MPKGNAPAIVLSMPNLIGPEEAMALTRPFHPLFHEAHTAAMSSFGQVAQEYPAFVKPLRPAEQYAILHRHIAEHLATHADDGAVYTEKLGFSALLLDARVLVRFKHLNPDYSIRVYPTDQQKHLARQQFTQKMMEQLALDGVGAPPAVLTLGYIESTDGYEIDQVAIVSRVPSLYYSYPVLAGDSAAGPTVVTPFPGLEPPGPRVISKREEDEQQDKGD